LSEDKLEISKEDIDKAFESGNGSKVARYALSVLGGLIPFAGGVIGGAAGAWSDHESDQFKKMLRMWLQMQQDEVEEIGRTLFEVMDRLNQNDERIRERIESKEYLSLVKKCFRDWSAAESEEKRILIRNLLANSASCKLSMPLHFGFIRISNGFTGYLHGCKLCSFRLNAPTLGAGRKKLSIQRARYSLLSSLVGFYF
jgi:hypothetical protein